VRPPHTAGGNSYRSAAVFHLIRGGGPTLKERRASGPGGSTGEWGGEEADPVSTSRQTGAFLLPIIN
jgi:hypothetical protein